MCSVRGRRDRRSPPTQPRGNRDRRGYGDVVTGEAVVLDLRLARLASRSLALAIDLAAQLTLLFAGVFVVAGAVTVVDDSLAAAIGLVFYLAVVVGYPVTWETFTRGRSPGKMALGLRVVREDGGPVRFRQAFVRGLLAVVEIWITSEWSPWSPRWPPPRAGGWATTWPAPSSSTSGYRCARRPSPPCPRSPPGWAQGLDLSRVPDALALEARQFLGRAPSWRPRSVSNGHPDRPALAAVVAPAPPPGVPAWAFVAAVLAERRRREAARPRRRPAARGPRRPPGRRRRPRLLRLPRLQRLRNSRGSRPAGRTRGKTVRAAVLTVGLRFGRSVEQRSTHVVATGFRRPRAPPSTRDDPVTSGPTPHEQFAVIGATPARRTQRRGVQHDRGRVRGPSSSTAATGPPSGSWTGDTFRSAAATDDVMRLIDELQNQVGEGPCLEASTDGIVQVDNDITVAAAGRAGQGRLERTPVRA